MINDKMIDALAYADDEFISESMPLEGEDAFKAPRRRRRIRTSLIAVCLVLVLSAAVYAAGVLTGTIGIYKSKDNQPGIAYSKSVWTIDGVEVDHINVDALLPIVSEKEITGPVRDDAAGLLKEKQDKGELDSYEVRENENSPWHTVQSDEYIVDFSRSFSGQKELLDYIGCRYYEEMYIPGAISNASAGVTAALFKDDDPSDCYIETCDYEIRSKYDNIDINTQVHMFFGVEPIKEGRNGFTSLGGVIDDGSSSVESFTNANGYNGAKIYANEDSRWERYYIRGCIIKNGCFYSINIQCDWADKSDADKVFDTWAEHF